MLIKLPLQVQSNRTLTFKKSLRQWSVTFTR